MARLACVTAFVCSNIQELSQSLAEAHRVGRKMSTLDLSQLNHIVAYAPEDMTVTVECGVKLNELQDRLRGHRQWLPLDPRFPDCLTIEQLISHNLSGPRRHGYGTVREHLIGLRVVLADGRSIHSGGRVVKNVAGYDLAKLFVGARGTLGVPVEATFKLLPLPEQECLLQRRCQSLNEAGDTLQAVFDSALTPVVMDLAGGRSDGSCAMILGMAGTEEDVAWQRQLARELGIDQPADWSYESEFWVANKGEPPRQWSVAPSRLVEALAELDGEPWLARAGQGLVFHRGHERHSSRELPVKLMRRLKSDFDPNAVLPDLPW
jgi:FAD/FMN-containing dehydrogenase